MPDKYVNKFILDGEVKADSAAAAGAWAYGTLGQQPCFPSPPFSAKKEAARPWEAGRAMGEEIGKKEQHL